MVKFEKMHASTAKHPRNLGAHHIVEISSILHNIHVVFRDQEKIVFYINNYIDWNKFNQLYAPNWLEKSVWNAKTIAQKLIPASIKAIDLRRKKTRKKQKVVDQQKVKAIAKKRWRDRRRSSLLIEDDEYYDNETFADPDQKNGLNSLENDWNLKWSLTIDEWIGASVVNA